MELVLPIVGPPPPSSHLHLPQVFVMDFRDSDLFHAVEDAVRHQNAWKLGIAEPVYELPNQGECLLGGSGRAVTAGLLRTESIPWLQCTFLYSVSHLLSKGLALKNMSHCLRPYQNVF